MGNHSRNDFSIYNIISGTHNLCKVSGNFMLFSDISNNEKKNNGQSLPIQFSEIIFSNQRPHRQKPRNTWRNKLFKHASFTAAILLIELLFILISIELT